MKLAQYGSLPRYFSVVVIFSLNFFPHSLLQECNFFRDS